ncbi:hypothetical protein T4C_410 [Trichinella pseudospiralis]|uniref:Uncharacterized protein n=1 Tax=Trichinella pseudospiralis TaxID=6337 RepID=A0A0V1K208_TRIPS|nr:hypothetical protein T4C_410 [Trichinella pseudospiralis]
MKKNLYGNYVYFILAFFDTVRKGSFLPIDSVSQYIYDEYIQLSHINRNSKSTYDAMRTVHHRQTQLIVKMITEFKFSEEQQTACEMKWSFSNYFPSKCTLFCQTVQSLLWCWQTCQKCAVTNSEKSKKKNETIKLRLRNQLTSTERWDQNSGKILETSNAEELQTVDAKMKF